MKFKIMVNTILATAILGASGAASAAALPWGWSGSLQNWETLGSVLDKNPPLPSLGTSTPAGTGDGDTTFSYVSSNNFDVTNTSIGLTEQQVNGQDLYNVGVGFLAGQTSGYLAYNVSTTDARGFNRASIGSIVTIGGNGGDVTEKIYSSNGGKLLLTLDSKNGSTVPPTGLASFSGLKSLYIVDTITTNAGIQDFHNNLSAVPEAEEWAMMLLGLPMVGWMIRRKQAVNLVAA